MVQKKRPETDSRNLPGGVVPDRTAIPDPSNASARAGFLDHPATTAPIEPVEGITEPLPEPKKDQR